jgi:hypothetical protein
MHFYIDGQSIRRLVASSVAAEPLSEKLRKPAMNLSPTARQRMPTYT